MLIEVLGILGIVLIGAGFSLIHVPIALIVVGFLLIILAAKMARIKSLELQAVSEQSETKK
jgi:hypothetical protein